MKTKPMPTQEYLKQCLDYDPETGVFTWKVRPIEHFYDKRSWKIWNTKHSNNTAGTSFTRGDGKSYMLISIGRYKCIYAHRLAVIYMEGFIDPLMQVDHLNGDGLDNRYKNIRVVTSAENSKNLRKQTRNKTGVTGVYRYESDGKYHPSIGVNGITIKLGSFTNFDDAVRARKNAEIKYGYHKNHGTERPL